MAACALYKINVDLLVDINEKLYQSLVGFTELEFLKLWKGLFVCMWHSDKPLVQVSCS